jgi:hypothetical protein
VIPLSTRRRVTFGLLASTALVASCHDAPTAPASMLVPGIANHSLLDATEVAPASASASISFGESQLLGYYPQRTRVVAHLSGFTTLFDG